MKKLIANSFSKKLRIAFLLIGLLPLFGVSVLYQNILNHRILEKTETSSIEKLRYLSLTIRQQADTAEQLLGWISYNQNLHTILQGPYERLYEKQLDIIKFSSYVTEYTINANVESSIQKILIMDEHGDSFQMGNSYSLLMKDEIIKEGWLETYRNAKVSQVVMNHDRYMPSSYVFPVSRRIYHNLTGKPIGWCLIVFDDDMYSKYLSNAREPGNEENLLLVNESGQCLADAMDQKMGMDLSADLLVSQILHSGQNMGSVTGTRDGESVILHYYRIPDTDMIEIQETSLESFEREQRNMAKLTVSLIVSTVVLILGVIFFMGNTLMRPINQISAYVKKVPENGFKGNLTLEGEDEFQKIAESINVMEKEILHLMEEQRQEAEVKKQLEFQVLQNQINPHFLYNTLNSIKWMAALQHADNIRDMTAALGRLLQNIAKGTDVKIPIYEEMSLLDDYVLIQNIRYEDRIHMEYHIGNPDITQAYIVKFLLQPIIENAIFHGIEPKEGIGNIDIYLDRSGDEIVISIVDQGVGMTEDQVNRLLHPENDEKPRRGLNGIGVANIHERIQLTYGKQYGLTITSQPGCFTNVTIRIPYEKEG